MKKKKLSLLWGYLQGSRGLLAFSLLSGTISTAAKLLIPFFAGKAINVLFDEAGNKDISAYLVLMGVLLVLGTAFRYLFDYLTYLVGQRVVTRMRTAVFASYMDANLSALDSHSEGDLTLRLMSDVENVNNGLVTGFASLYDGVISIVLTIAFMMSLNYILGFIVIVLTPISLLVSRFISKFNSKHYKRQGKQSGELQAFLSETLEGSESVYALGAEDERTEGFENINEAYREATFKANMGASIINPLTRLVNAVVNCAVLIVGALFIAGNWQVGIVFLVALGETGTGLRGCMAGVDIFLYFFVIYIHITQYSKNKTFIWVMQECKQQMLGIDHRVAQFSLHYRLPQQLFHCLAHPSPLSAARDTGIRLLSHVGLHKSLQAADVGIRPFQQAVSIVLLIAYYAQHQVLGHYLVAVQPVGLHSAASQYLLYSG